MGILSGLLAGVILFAAAPTSTNYKLPAYDVGSGGTDSSSSTNFGLNAISGSQTGDQHTSTSYSLASGLNPTQNANVPPAPALSNPSSYYNKLHLVVDNGGNPTDTVFLIAISTDNFVTTDYVQPDNSISPTFTLATYRTYASYGGGSGFLILGLQPNTTYKVKVKALRGNFTESAYGPMTTGVATIGQTLSFGLTTSLSAVPPFVADFASLSAGSVFSADADLNITMTTNASSGGTVYIKSFNSALMSASASYSINSSTADLSAASSGYGAQVVSTSQTSGGPIVSQATFNGVADNVGLLTNIFQKLLTTSNPVVGATSTFQLKAKANATVPATSDYSDILTVVAATNY